MRHVRSLLVSLALLPCSTALSTAHNVCVHAADGAIVCGPVAEVKATASPSPFDQPGVAQPIAPAPPPPGAPAKTAQRSAPQAGHLPKHVYRGPPPKFDVRPQRIARQEPRRLTERSQLPPSRHVTRDRHEHERNVVPTRVDREAAMMRHYDERLRELEREVRALRADREAAWRRDRYLMSQRAPHRRDRYTDND
jgi:hypothetical protein